MGSEGISVKINRQQHNSKIRWTAKKKKFKHLEFETG